MQNGGEGLPNIVLACRGILVKVLITLEPHCLFYSNFVILLIHINIIKTQVCKTVIRLCQKFFGGKDLVTILDTCVSIMLKCI